MGRYMEPVVAGGLHDCADFLLPWRSNELAMAAYPSGTQRLGALLHQPVPKRSSPAHDSLKIFTQEIALFDQEPSGLAERRRYSARLEYRSSTDGRGSFHSRRSARVRAKGTLVPAIIMISPGAPACMLRKAHPV